MYCNFYCWCVFFGAAVSAWTSTTRDTEGWRRPGTGDSTSQGATGSEGVTFTKKDGHRDKKEAPGKTWKNHVIVNLYVWETNNRRILFVKYLFGTFRPMNQGVHRIMIEPFTVALGSWMESLRFKSRCCSGFSSQLGWTNTFFRMVKSQSCWSGYIPWTCSVVIYRWILCSVATASFKFLLLQHIWAKPQHTSRYILYQCRFEHRWLGRFLFVAARRSTCSGGSRFNTSSSLELLEMDHGQ